MSIGVSTQETKENEKKFQRLLKKIKSVKAGGGVDLSVAEDLAIAVMNLISLEEHFFFTGAKTKDGAYYDLGGEVRELRKKLLADLVPHNEGETWCVSKHLLATTMRLLEVGSKFLADGDKARAAEYFESAHKAYAIFLLVKSKLVEARRLADTLSEHRPWSMDELISRLADCCDEKGETLSLKRT